MKLRSIVPCRVSNPVAPYVGAWIETRQLPCRPEPAHVAPYVGAWIETYYNSLYINALCVAPYVGAWIETLFTVTALSVVMSHPTWVRGLKL